MRRYPGSGGKFRPLPARGQYVSRHISPAQGHPESAFERYRERPTNSKLARFRLSAVRTIRMVFLHRSMRPASTRILTIFGGLSGTRERRCTASHRSATLSALNSVLTFETLSELSHDVGERHLGMRGVRTIAGTSALDLSRKGWSLGLKRSESGVKGGRTQAQGRGASSAPNLASARAGA